MTPPPPDAPDAPAPAQPPEMDLRRKTMAISALEGSFAAVSQVLGDNYMTPYALSLALTPVQIGVMGSVSGLVLPLGQIWGSRLMAKLRRKTILKYFVPIQAVMWFFILGVGVLSTWSLVQGATPYLLLFFVFLYNLFGGVIGPSWVSLMGDIIPEAERGRYFGMRNLAVNSAALLVTLGASFLLESMQAQDAMFLGFVIILGTAGLSRLASGLSFRFHYDPPFRVSPEDHLSLRQFLKSLRTENFGRFTVFMNLISLAAWVAGPFFGVYMLDVLHFNFSTYVAVILSSTVFSLFFFKPMGKFADKYGNRQLLKFGALLIPLSPVLWILFTNPIGIILSAQMVGGMGWTAFNLASANFIYDNIPASKRGEYTAYYSLVVGVGTILGGLIGSGIFALLTFGAPANYHFLFGLSGGLRALVVVLFLPGIKEVRAIGKYVPAFRGMVPFRWLVEWRLRIKGRNGRRKPRSQRNPSGNDHISTAK